MFFTLAGAWLGATSLEGMIEKVVANQRFISVIPK